MLASYLERGRRDKSVRPFRARVFERGRSWLSARRIPLNALQPGSTPGIESYRKPHEKTQLRRGSMVIGGAVCVNKKCRRTEMLFCDFTRSIISLGRRVKTKTRAGFPTRVFSIGRLRESIRDRYDAGWALRLAAQVRWFGDFAGRPLH